MTDTEPSTRLIELVQAGDHAGLTEALRAGAPVGERDEDDWCALDWAAGRGDEIAIRTLLDHGADPTAAGGDQRRPYQIAVAAGQVAAARVLRAAEQSAGDGAPADYLWRPYCKAYPIADLRRFPGWPQVASDDAGAPDDRVVFIHDDLTVTASMWRDDEVILAEVSEEWTRFCHESLGFRVPDDLDLVPPAPPAAN